MADRPLKWFLHYHTQHERCVLLLNKYGFEGYGRYDYLQEFACTCADYVIPSLLLELSILLDTTEVELEAFLNDLVSYGLMEKVEGGWRPVAIKECADRYEEMCNKNRENIKKRWAKKNGK